MFLGGAVLAPSEDVVLGPGAADVIVVDPAVDISVTLPPTLGIATGWVLTIIGTGRTAIEILPAPGDQVDGFAPPGAYLSAGARHGWMLRADAAHRCWDVLAKY